MNQSLSSTYEAVEGEGSGMNNQTELERSGEAADLDGFGDDLTQEELESLRQLGLSEY
jgi:hypothetical protein